MRLWVLRPKKGAMQSGEARFRHSLVSVLSSWRWSQLLSSQRSYETHQASSALPRGKWTWDRRPSPLANKTTFYDWIIAF